MYLDQFNALLKIVFSMLLGGVIGWERESFDKPAGFRTHMFIAGASTLFIILANFIVEGFEQSSLATVSVDPIRVIEAIIVGVSFVGGGMIIQQKKTGVVQNLTTASSLLFTVGIGISVSLNKVVLAVSLTIITVLVNRGLFLVEKRYFNK